MSGPPPALLAPPLFECFVNVPHPAASRSSGPPMVVIPAPHAPADARLMQQIQAFCFPEYDDAVHTAAFANMAVNRFDQYAMQPKSFSSFTFTLQLQDGRRLHGHVRRSLPLHEKAPTRYDVGRRGERALVLLTQIPGAGQLYQAILKTVDAIASLQKALSPELIKEEEPEKLFLYGLYREQQRMAAHYQQRPVEERGKPLIAALSGVEIHRSPLFVNEDVNRFMIPTCLLHYSFSNNNSNNDDSKAAAALQQLPTADSTSSLLPLLRCVGVAHALRILAALLSERRIILTSSSPTRLSTCSHAALAMLHCGLLHWQHLYIPVLPPHLWQYLAAPYPYLIGILQSATSKLDKTDGLGEVLIVHLDSNSMETRNIPQLVVAQRLPDLFLAADPSYYNESGGNTPHKGKDAPPSAAELLAQDLLDILKTDKKVLNGETTALANVGETAGKAAKAIKSGFSKLKAKLKGQSSNVGKEDTAGEEGPELNDESTQVDCKSVADDYIFTEGCHNEVGEQEARLAFTEFFLSLIGNMRWYLSVPGGGELPQLDRMRFLDHKRQHGDGPGSALWPLLQNFTQTQMLEEFAKARVEELRLRQTAPGPDAPLFAQCSQYHRQHNVDFGIQSVRRVARQVAQANPGRLTGLLQTNARRMAMTLTSNRNFEGDSGRAMAQLVEQCRESSSVLLDVMSVIWLRLRDTKGGHWKHGHLAMMLLKNLLYHGPLAAVADATDGLDKIRALKLYENMRGHATQEVRTVARTLFDLLVDRSKLWTIRRLCAKKRRDLTIPAAKRPRLEKMVRVKLTDDIVQVHGAFHPLARATIVQVPPQQSPMPQPVISNFIAVPAPTPDNDLFGFDAPPSDSGPVPSTTGTSDLVDPDLMGLFDTMDVAMGSSSFDLEDKPAPFVAQPTIVALPPEQPYATEARATSTSSTSSLGSISFTPQPPASQQPPPPPQQYFAAPAASQAPPPTPPPAPRGPPPTPPAVHQYAPQQTPPAPRYNAVPPPAQPYYGGAPPQPAYDPFGALTPKPVPPEQYLAQNQYQQQQQYRAQPFLGQGSLVQAAQPQAPFYGGYQPQPPPPQSGQQPPFYPQHPAPPQPSQPYYGNAVAPPVPPPAQPFYGNPAPQQSPAPQQPRRSKQFDPFA